MLPDNIGTSDRERRLVTEAHPKTIRFAGARLSRHRHVCAFFNGDEGVFEVLGPFIRDGFQCDHRAVHLVGADKRDAHIARLRCEGIDTEASQLSGQLEIRSTADEYLQGGRFDRERMVEAFTALASGNRDGKYPLSRIVCDMDWAAEAPDHLQDLIEFESQVNDLWSKHDDVVICVYDLAKFGGDMIVDILRTHPLAVIGGILRENPFYIPPAQFLAESRERRSGKEEQSAAAE
ncbi:MEDS domain-containing protein [Mycoplana sp. MJR14]|uniref:MEDS domain-containing protein n=1 Tax=Mycoplana sp. MJR14 TaxID=3032583 RepID=UPI0023DA33AF|nr:MEDS domain-containing protein [Mycoplana sp. MJR14]